MSESSLNPMLHSHLNIFNQTYLLKLIVLVTSKHKNLQDRIQHDGYLQKLFDINFKLKVLLCWKIIFKPV